MSSYFYEPYYLSIIIRFFSASFLGNAQSDSIVLDVGAAASNSVDNNISSVPLPTHIETNEEDTTNRTLSWGSFIVAVLSLFIAVLGIMPAVKSRVLKWKQGKIRVNFLLSGGKMNERISKNSFTEAEDTPQLTGRFIYDIYGTSEMRKMTIRDISGKRLIYLPYKELINFIENPNAKIEICPKELLNANLKTGEKLISALLPEEIIRATDSIVYEVLKSIPKTFNGTHTRLHSFEKINDDLYRCSLEKTCYFAQIRTNLSLDYPITVNERDTSIRNIELHGHNTFVPFNESTLANVIGVSAIWCLDGKNKNTPEERMFYLLPRINEVGVYANRLGTPAGDVECPKNGIFFDDSLVDFLKWEIAREFFEETGVSSDSYAQETCYERVDMEVLDDNKKKRAIARNNKCFYKCKRFEIIPLAFLREMLRGGKPMMFFLIRTEWIDDSILYKCFKKSLGKLEFKKSLFSSANLSTEATYNYLYAQAYLQNKPNPDDCVDLSRNY